MIIRNFKPHLDKIQQRLQPQLDLVINKWQSLQPREQKLVGGLGAVVVLTILFMGMNSLIAYKSTLDNMVHNLSSVVGFSKQVALNYKNIKSVEANTFNTVSVEQIKGDVSQLLQVKEPDILLQDGQMTISVPNTQFSQVMTLLDQLRRSYAIFPSQLNIIRQSRSGFVSFSATFWVKQ